MVGRFCRIPGVHPVVTGAANRKVHATVLISLTTRAVARNATRALVSVHMSHNNHVDMKLLNQWFDIVNLSSR
jgi:hypothetical protein